MSLSLQQLIEKYTKCGRKKRYKTKNAAKIDRIKLVGSKPGYNYVVYQCKKCGDWHVGSKRKSNNALRKKLTLIHKEVKNWKQIEE